MREQGTLNTNKDYRIKNSLYTKQSNIIKIFQTRKIINLRYILKNTCCPLMVSYSVEQEEEFEEEDHEINDEDED